MAMSGWHLAHLNVARMRAPIDAPEMQGFVAELDAINAIADAAPGFVWRLTGEDPDDPAIVSLGPLMLVNMSLWSDVEALAHYVYRTAHAAVLKRRGEWFLPLETANSVLWWVPQGHIPSLAEAVARLKVLDERGPTPEAFTFRRLSLAPSREGPP
jgi:hypothetical protein